MTEVSPADARAKIRALVSEVAPKQPDLPIGPDTRLVDDLLFDSVALLELIVALESDFDLPPINPADTTGIESVGQLEAFVLENSGAGRH